jgi:hypothetical protein
MLLLTCAAPALAGRGVVLEPLDSKPVEIGTPNPVSQVSARLPGFDRAASESDSVPAPKVAPHRPRQPYAPTHGNPLLTVLALLVALFVWVAPAKNLFFPNSTMQRRPPPRLMAAHLQKVGRVKIDVDPEQLQIRYKPTRRQD